MKSVTQSRVGVASIIGITCVVGAAIALSQQAALQSVGQEHAEALSHAFRSVSNMTLPAVVSVETRTKAVQLSQEESSQAPDGNDPFEQFFRSDPRLRDMFRQQSIPPRRGAGSGFIIDPQGVILTNSHVVENADTVLVRLQDGREIEATSWVSDPRSDVAIIRIEVDDALPTIAFGDSDQMEIGDWVLALGNPFDLGTTVTAGIISAKQRTTGINERESYLQTDAAINPGNSGGPLVNLQGQVIGINTAISSSSGGYDGVGFAIPINSARWVAEQLMTSGSVRRAYLGVVLVPMDTALRKGMKLPFDQGALIGEVRADTPAAKAGLKTGDVVVKCDGKTVHDQSHLQGLVEALEIGKSYPFEVLRYTGDGTVRETISVTMEEMPEEFTPAMRRSNRGSRGTPKAESFNEIGVEIAALNTERREQLGLARDVQGVVITAVKPDSPAADAELEAGDVIEKFGAFEVTSPEEFEKALKSVAGSEGVPVLVRRGEAPRFVFLKLSK